nr:MAG TPA: hypothetical protein [Caudoviricetes sp.]
MLKLASLCPQIYSISNLLIRHFLTSKTKRNDFSLRPN